MPLSPHLQHFTDREPQIRAFDALWPGDERWILAYSGQSGNGKSTLIEWLIETRCRLASDLAWRKVDFYLIQPLEAIPCALAEMAGHEAAAHFDQQARRARERYNAIVEEINRTRAGASLHLNLQQQAIAGGAISSSPPTIDARLSDELRAMYAPHQEQLERELARAALDVLPALGARRAVLFLDTYERFAEANPPQSIARLWELLEQAAGRATNLRVVVSGRQDLPYAPLRHATRLERLGEFSPDDCERFLVEWGVEDAVLRRAAFEWFQGHPLSTRLLAEVYRDTRRAGQPLTADVIHTKTLAASYDEWLYGLVLKHLPQPLYHAARYGPLLRHFNHASLNAALSQKLSDADFGTLTTRAFIKPLAPGRYAFHEVVRRVQIAYLTGADDPEAQAVHTRARADARQKMESGRDPEAWQDVVYHDCFLDPVGQFETWRQVVDKANFDFDHVWWNELLEVMEVPAIRSRLKTDHQADVFFRRGRWYYYHDGWHNVLEEYDRALPLYQTARNVSGEANVLKAQGDVLYFLKRTDEALSKYEAALGLFKAVGDRLGEANVLLSWGRLALSMGDEENGLKQLERAAQLYDAIGAQAGSANVCIALAQLAASKGDLQAAIRYMQPAADFCKRIGHPLGDQLQAQIDEWKKSESVNE